MSLGRCASGSLALALTLGGAGMSPAAGTAPPAQLTLSAPSPFEPRTLPVDGVERRYRVFRPRGERPAAGWPVILFLHGSGERGDDGELPTQVGLGPAIARDPAAFPFAAVFPQALPGQTWSPAMERVALAELEATLAELGGDRSRLYLVGISMGGNGVLRIAARQPARFAALVTVCGFPVVPGRMDLTEEERAAYALGNPFLGQAAGPGAPAPRELAEATGFAPPPGRGDPFAAAAAAIASLPVWIAHGTEDPVVPVAASRRLARELAARRAAVRMRLYPGVGHGAWEPAFAEAGLWRWLAAQRR